MHMGFDYLSKAALGDDSHIGETWTVLPPQLDACLSSMLKSLDFSLACQVSRVHIAEAKVVPSACLKKLYCCHQVAT